MSIPVASPTTLIPVEDVKQWVGQEVLDLRDDKLGKLEDVFYDTETDLPVFAAVRSGLFGKHLTLVALRGASAGRDYLRAAIDKSAFKKAPSFDPAAELTIDDETAAYEHYGLEYRPTDAGTRRLAKH
ncbi:MAG: hypothetical protein QOG15_640 [Solirubrobacteraceae bacterium]|jgi:hypothetical protein|nr:hypothetical protein [Solirubrobacteraceae bacterium]